MFSKIELIDGNTVMDLNIIQFLCTVITIGFFLIGMLTCRKIYNQNSVQDVNFLPFVMTSLNCILWTAYGWKVEDSTIVLVNSSGAVLQAIYILVFLKYLKSFDEVKYCLKVLVGVAVTLLLVFLFIKHGSDASRKNQNLGLICDFFTILMFASPLSTLRKVIVTKSTRSISLPLSIMVFFVSMSWLSYGALIKDFYVTIPNGIGAFLGIIQIALFCIYPFDNSKTSNL